MQNNYQTIISGSSVTDDTAWPTWATWTKKLYGWTNVIDISARGLGNKVIILQAVKNALDCVQTPFIILQLTSVDKWDWYVEDKKLVDILNKERHPIVLLDKQDEFGFWSTGSHFPLYKEYYQKNYFGIQFQAFESALMLQWFQMLCKEKGWPFVVIFESPIFSVTESQLNQGQLDKHDCQHVPFLGGTLCKNLQLNLSNIYTPGLIGYACLNDLPWFHPKFKSHPGSYVHYCFTRDILISQLDRFWNQCCDLETFETEAKRFQNLVND